LVVALVTMSFAPASSFAALAEREATEPVAHVVDAYVQHAVMPPVSAVASATRDRNVTRTLRLVTFVAILLGLAVALAGFSSSSRARRGSPAVPRLSFASGVSRRGPPPVG
jgi:hypothetical protein